MRPCPLFVVLFAVLPSTSFAEPAMPDATTRPGSGASSSPPPVQNAIVIDRERMDETLSRDLKDLLRYEPVSPSRFWTKGRPA
jgi:hypothetical protein